MKKNGFTLIELLAVVTIIATLLLLAVPRISNQLNNSKDNVNDKTKKIIYSATEKYMKDFNIDPKDTYCIPIEDLVKDEYLSDTVAGNNLGISLKDKEYVEIEYTENRGYSYQLNSKKTCNQEMGMLSEGLVPVTYDGDNWVVVSQSNKNGQWYDYDNQKWANAVVLSQEAKANHKNEVGSIVTVDGENPDVLMMYVWIPRYEYKIEGQYGRHSDGTEGTQQLPGEIKVNFITKSITQDKATEGYHVHPAFTFGEKEESGFWVGKFELSHTELSSSTDENNLECTNGEDGVTCTADSSKFRILPNVQSLRYNNVSNFWYGIKSIESESSYGLTNIDIHLIKNSEWGAVAYLSQSKYGKYRNSDYKEEKIEIYQNKSSSYITGLSNGTPSQNIRYTQCTYNQKKGPNLDQDQNNCGPGASTTGNIYGVYDMSGGSNEYVMGAYGSEGEPKISQSGFSEDPNVFTTVAIDPKYYDVYSNETNMTDDNGSLSCNNGICYGSGLSETISWYGDASAMVYSNFPWFVRGDDFNGNTGAGVFYRSYSIGSMNGSYSARVVVFKK